MVSLLPNVMSSWERRHPPSTVPSRTPGRWRVAFSLQGTSSIIGTIFSSFTHLSLFLIIFIFSCADGYTPRFFENSRLTFLRVPATTEPGTIIYRLRAEDMDRQYPLQFNIRGESIMCVLLNI